MTRYVNKLMSPSLRGEAWDNLAGYLDNVSPFRVAILHDRIRHIDDAKVTMLRDSIRATGLLHAIGVRYMTDAEKAGRSDECTIALLYGAHRLEAHKSLHISAEQSGDRDELNRWDLIPAIIYPEAMNASWALELEIIENLVRYDLTTEQKSEHTVRLAALYKERGEVQGAIKRGHAGRQKKNESGATPLSSLPIALAPPPAPLPTTTQKLVENLGVTRDTVQDRVAAVAKATGTKGLSVEKSSAQELMAAADRMAPIAAKKEIDKANKKAAAEAERKAKVVATKNAKTKNPKRSKEQKVDKTQLSLGDAVKPIHPPVETKQPSLNDWQKNMQAKWFSAGTVANQKWFLKWAQENMLDGHDDQPV